MLCHSPEHEFDNLADVSLKNILNFITKPKRLCKEPTYFPFLNFFSSLFQNSMKGTTIRLKETFGILVFPQGKANHSTSLPITSIGCRCASAF